MKISIYIPVKCAVEFCKIVYPHMEEGMLYKEDKILIKCLILEGKLYWLLLIAKREAGALIFIMLIPAHPASLRGGIYFYLLLRFLVKEAGNFDTGLTEAQGNLRPPTNKNFSLSC